MRITILFGGTNKERLVSVATAQALHTALPEADLWFWAADDAVHETSGKALLGHSRPFEDAFKPDGARISGSIEQAMDRAKTDDRLLVLGLHGGRAENGELQARCAASPSPVRARRRPISPSTRSRPSALRRSPASIRPMVSRFPTSRPPSPSMAN